MGDDDFSNKDEAFQAFDDIPLSPPTTTPWGPFWPVATAAAIF
jgi:hypothetical protein